ncbi:MAG: flippase-like domain-containing protein [Planctomycetes bacterium]|nr:flippase-like domain-containing protein [Planctomycetota bacterium]
MKKHVVNAIKLLLVVVMFWYVFENVQWDDVVVTTGGDGEVVATVHGEVEGSWDANPVVLQTADGPRSLPIGPLPDGGSSVVTPGILTYVRNLDALYFSLGALCYLLTLTVSASRWWWLLRVNELDVSFWQSWRLTWIGVFFNNVVPGQTGGDVVKALYIVKRCPQGRVEALMSVIVDRILGLASLALLGAIVVLFQLDRFGVIAAGIWAVLAACCVIGGLAFSRRVRRAIRLDQLLRKLPARLARPLMKVDHAVHFYRAHVRGVLAWLLGGTFNHGFTIASFWLMGQALGVGMPAGEYFVLIPVILIVSSVPIAPNGWGVGELLFGELFGRFGAVHLAVGVPDPVQMMRTRGVALSVLYRLHTTAWSLIGGIMLLIDRDRVTRAEFEAEIARESREEQAALQGEVGTPATPTAAPTRAPGET